MVEVHILPEQLDERQEERGPQRKGKTMSGGEDYKAQRHLAIFFLSNRFEINRKMLFPPKKIIEYN